MKKAIITTPENIEVEYRLAGVGSRVVAGFLDYFIQGILYLVILLVLAGMKDPVKYLESQNSYTVAISLLIIAFINYGYFTVSEMIMNGRTPGKKALGLKTIRKNGQPIDIKHSLIRNLFKTFVDNYIVGILMIFFRRDCSRVGDILSSTMVIEEKKEKLHLTDSILSEDIKEIISDEDKELLIAYIQEKPDVSIDKEKLQEKMLGYFRDKYNDIDEGIIGLIEGNINK